ncbi:TOMM precursor leader peptide-binding protein [Rhizobium leguminosarum]|uniref:TOMM precursor leader peptide-binding protein n=1 Tax=Rhizobium leguminosarum TaxID=384 RepID=UPI0016497FC7|nr:TOMM precursor leader peptide-binding protein [Rhizobium leguminosarum]
MRKVRGGRELAILLDELKKHLDDGPQTEEKLKTDLQASYPPAYVEEALHHFLNLGVVVYTDENAVSDTLSKRDERVSSPTRQYLFNVFDETEQAFEKLKACDVALVGQGRLAEKVLSGLIDLSLRSISWAVNKEATSSGENRPDFAGFEYSPYSDDEDLKRRLGTADFVIAVADDPIERLRLFPKVNAISLSGGQQPWLCGYMDGHQAFIGPLFVPGETGCYRCLELREEQHLPYPEEFASFKQSLAHNKIVCAPDAPSSTLQVASGFITAEAQKAIARVGHPATFQTLVVIDLNYLETERHRLLRVPFCDTCGTHLNQPFCKTWDM